jgi:uncharacterized damage-inducible protein DinB
MSQPVIGRPNPGEYDPFYQGYLDHVPQGDILGLLELQLGKTLEAVRGLTDEQARFRYAPGKWSIKQVIGHLADAERVLSYRAFRFSRDDPTALPGFEEDDYVANSVYDERPLEEVVEELARARAASIAFFRSLTPEMTTRRGVANEAEITVRALPWIIVGHERHHLAVLRERYFPRI